MLQYGTMHYNFLLPSGWSRVEEWHFLHLKNLYLNVVFAFSYAVAMVWMLVSSKNSCWNLIAIVTVLRGGCSKRGLGHEGSALLNELASLSWEWVPYKRRNSALFCTSSSFFLSLPPSLPHCLPLFALSPWIMQQEGPYQMPAPQYWTFQPLETKSQ